MNLTIEFQNSSIKSQNWQISNGKHFILESNWSSIESFIINIDYTFNINIYVDTPSGFIHARATLNYNFRKKEWSLDTETPNHWLLIQYPNTDPILHCFLGGALTDFTK
ncbi:hypothetical protein [Clostridium scatologenes]|uniref:hypothetical protein n=1 Tax=Clostridium scatologenes TaxID=1548 RepID=UPI00048AD801|nr:hypothetical protein [Clostridium scatologenes]